MTRNSLLVLFCVLFGMAGITVVAQQAIDDIAKYPGCSHCNMNRERFAQSRMLIKYEDGTEAPTCSSHCAAVDMAINFIGARKNIKSVEVGDFKTRVLINAETAYWVIGGNRHGVMSKRGKWAFAEKKDAEEFLKENGGTLGSFDDAMSASFEDMYGFMKMIRERRGRPRPESAGGPNGMATPAAAPTPAPATTPTMMPTPVPSH